MIYLVLTLLALLAVSVYYCIRFGIIILKIQDSIEQSLDIIDEKYETISEILERPLFYDSREVRQVLEDIKDTRSSLHDIAFTLYKDFEPTEEEVQQIEG